MWGLRIVEINSIEQDDGGKCVEISVDTGGFVFPRPSTWSVVVVTFQDASNLSWS